jgi:hypothetical protein
MAMSSRYRTAATRSCLIVLTAVSTAWPAHAYVGPGAGLTAIGTVLALAAAFCLAIVGFVWYPLKRLLRRGKSRPYDKEQSKEA